MRKLNFSSYTSAGLISAFAASLCCITPAIAVLAGTSSIASTFSWIDSLRPYLIGLTILVLATAWYLKLKQEKPADLNCDCEETKSSTFLQSKMFLALVTVFAIVMMTFPLYSHKLYKAPRVNTSVLPAAGKSRQVLFTIEGMTCASCEGAVNNELSKVLGIRSFKTSYSKKNSLVSFDESKTNVKSLVAAISKTGYKVTGYSNK